MSHEKDDMAGRPLLLGSLVFVVVLFLAWAIPTAMESWLQGGVVGRREVTDSIAWPGRSLPAGPRLQVNPDRDIERLRAAEQEHLTTYGWVDSNAGIVRIPIERAIQMTLADVVAASPTEHVQRSNK
jgi:hypothetical protein